MYDLLLQNTRLVRPNTQHVIPADIAISNGKIARVASFIDPNQAEKVIDAKNQLAFPGLVDAHMHTGIYAPLAEDARTESKAAAQGGVTSSLNYIRTGAYYLNKGGDYADFFPEVLAQSEQNFWVDYAYHLAPMQSSHIDEMEMLFTQHGVSSFKVFMFYGLHGLHGKSASQKDFLMTPDGENYDYAHFEFVMRGLQEVRQQHPQFADILSLSLHCETAEIMRAYTKIVEQDISLSGLAAYSASRPPHSEGLAIFIAAYLAHETELANINLLHLTSRKAVDAAMMMKLLFPHINFRREVTIGHLLLDVDSPNGNFAKVNPPIRPRLDVEYLWEAVLAGNIDWICSDHACCKHELKIDVTQPQNVWVAKSGFGGAEYLLSGLFTEGKKRGLSLNRMAELVCWNPAQRYGLSTKGDIAEGYDADIVLFDDSHTWTIDSRNSESVQGYSPFDGMEVDGIVTSTYLRGSLVYHNGEIMGDAQGKYLKRGN